jgi:hypothetical protein
MTRDIHKNSELDVVLRKPQLKGLSQQQGKMSPRADSKTLATSVERACMMVNLRPKKVPADATWGAGPCASTTTVSQSFAAATTQQSLFVVFNITMQGRLEVPCFEWVAGAPPSGGAKPTGALRLRLQAVGVDAASK